MSIVRFLERGFKVIRKLIDELKSLRRNPSVPVARNKFCWGLGVRAYVPEASAGRTETRRKHRFSEMGAGGLGPALSTKIRAL